MKCVGVGRMARAFALAGTVVLVCGTVIECLSEGIPTKDLHQVYTMAALLDVGRRAVAGSIAMIPLLGAVSYVELLWFAAAGVAWYVAGRKKPVAWHIGVVVALLLWHLNGAGGGAVAIAHWIGQARIELSPEMVAERWLVNGGGLFVYVALVLAFYVLVMRRRAVEDAARAGPT